MAFLSPDDVTAGEMLYLRRRYADADEIDEHRERFVLTLKRLVRHEKDPAAIHHAVMEGLRLWRPPVNDTEELDARRTAVAQARRDVAKALASLRRLLPTDPDAIPVFRGIDDDELFGMRDILAPPPPPPAPRGRPRLNRARQTIDAGLKTCGVNEPDRRELLGALGLLADD